MTPEALVALTLAGACLILLMRLRALTPMAAP